MGVVFKAIHRTLERPVAIKRLAPHLSKNQNMLERFLKEARLQAKLSHPNVVNIFDLLEWEDEIHLVMEYVSGLSVKQMLQERGRLPIPEALAITEGVLKGLAFMHKHGIVHRDIKPSNIIVSPEGDVKVTDFGIARLVEDDSGLTRFGAGVGTLQYMAPELLKTGEVSFAVDMYGMGVTLYEMLTGHVPFSGNTDLEIMLGHIEKPPPPLELPDGEAEQACTAIVLKALAKDPAARFPTTEAFLSEVARLQELAAPPASFAPAPDAAAPSRPSGERKAGVARTDESGPDPDSAILETRPVIELDLPPQGEKAETPASSGSIPPAAVPDAAGRGGPEGQVPPPAEGVAPKASYATKPRSSSPRLLLALAAVLVLAAGGYLALRGGDTPPPAKQAAPAKDQAVSPAPSQTPPAPPAAAPSPAASPPAAGPDPKPSGAPTAQASAAAPASAASPAPPAPPTPVPPAAPAFPDAAVPPSATAPHPDAPTGEASKGPSDNAPGATPPEASTPGDQGTQPRYVYTQSKNVRLRDAPASTGKVVDALDVNTKLELLVDHGEWTQVRTAKGVIAYAASAQLGGRPVAIQTPARPQSTKPSGGDSGWRIVK